MKEKRLYAKRFLAGLMTVAMLGLCLGTTTPSAAASTPNPRKSETIHGSNTAAGMWSYNYSPYEKWSSPAASCLTMNDDGTLTRIEADEEDAIIRVETYSQSNHELQTAKNLSMKTPWDGYSGETFSNPIFGGFFLGKTYNYVFLGQKNTEQSDGKQVIRIVRYDKDWEIVDASNINHNKTVVPFDAGSLRCAEFGDMLYVHTCHKMYKSDDGLNHQANYRFCFNQSSNTVSDQHFDVSNEKTGYCSHSFNQFIDIQGTDIYTLDHGDAYPRGLYLAKYAGKAGSTMGDPTAFQTVLSFPGEIGDNTTKTALGGFAVSSSTCLIAYNQAGSTTQRNVCLGTIGKDQIGSGSLSVTTLDTPDSTSTCGNPMLTELSGDRYLIRWQMYTTGGKALKQTRYVIVDAGGNKVSDVKTVEAFLGDCIPDVSSDDVVSWYTTGTANGSVSAPTFYHLNTTSGEFTSAKAFTLPTLSAPTLKTINKKTGVLSGTGVKSSEIHILFQDREFFATCNKNKKFKLTLRKFYRKKLKRGAIIKIYATKNGYRDSKTKTYKVP